VGWGSPWSSGECRGLTIRAMVLGRGLIFWLHLKTRWKRWILLKAEKIMKITAQIGQVTPKKYN